MIFDGYPRTLGQARYLSEHLNIDIVLNLHLRQVILIRKLLGRRVCPTCKKSFNVEDVNEDDYCMPPMLPQNHDPTTCDNCANTQLIKREDDVKEIIEKRQQIYENQMHDIISYFESQGILRQFEPKKGVADYPTMRSIVFDFVN